MTYEPHPLDQTDYGQRDPALAEDAALLREHRALLGDRDQDFVISLLEAYDRFKGPSVKQEYWIRVKAARIRELQAQQSVPNPQTYLDLSRIRAMFAKAELALQHPFVLVDSTGGVLRIKPAGDGSKYRGQLMISTEGSFENRQWLGRIDHDGRFIRADIFTPVRDGLIDALKALAENPEAVAQAYGRKYGVCCFCSRKLTDERSVTAGYGPTCADRYGLDWGTVVVEEVREPLACTAVAGLANTITSLVDVDLAEVEPRFLAPLSEVEYAGFRYQVMVGVKGEVSIIPVEGQHRAASKAKHINAAREIWAAQSTQPAQSLTPAEELRELLDKLTASAIRLGEAASRDAREAIAVEIGKIRLDITHLVEGRL